MYHVSAHELRVPERFSNNVAANTGKQSSDFWTGNNVSIVIALMLLMIVSIINFCLSDGFEFYWVMAVISSMLFVGCAFVLMRYTYNSGKWIRLIEASLYDFLIVLIICITLSLSIYTSQSIRSAIFHVIGHFHGTSRQTFTQKRNFSVPYQNDMSLQDGYAVLTQFAQQIITMNQNPASCFGKTLLVGQFMHMGGGAEMHSYALLLGKAIDNEYIFAWGNAACSNWGGHCRDFFLPEHNCTAEQVSVMHTVTYETYLELAAVTTIPSVFANKLSEMLLGMTKAQQTFWWKAQGSAYLMRYNRNTQHNIASMRNDPNVNEHLNGLIPAGTVNVNIRMGDKFSEMRLPEPEDYMPMLERLYIDSPLAYSKWVYITSDSNDAIQRLAKTAGSNGWSVLFSNTPRMELGYVMADSKSFFDYNVTIGVLMQLTMATECAAWVGSRGSNWNRIIDERRCVLLPKCSAPFVEVAHEVIGLYDCESNIV